MASTATNQRIAGQQRKYGFSWQVQSYRPKLTVVLKKQEFGYHACLSKNPHTPPLAKFISVSESST